MTDDESRLKGLDDALGKLFPLAAVGFAYFAAYQYVKKYDPAFLEDFPGDFRGFDDRRLYILERAREIARERREDTPGV